MGMTIEVKEVSIYTVHLTDEDVIAIKNHIDRTRSSWMQGEKYSKREICEALSEMPEIDLFGDKSVESDCYTDEIRWSEYEDREPQEILENV